MTERRDWSEKDLRKMIVDQRRFMWRPETIECIAGSIRLQGGMTVADIGCGLGYLGWTYRPYFESTGTYVGLDCSEKLLADASELAADWRDGCTTLFVRSTAERIPLPDRSVDVAMCQTLLMHLADPQAALAEMIRITRPGGAILCKEPDNLSSMLAPGYSSDPEQSIPEQLYWARMNMIWAKGRKALGHGDYAVGAKLPRMMSEAGLVRIDARPNDKAYFLQPPYETEEQRYRLGKALEALDEAENRDGTEEERRWREWGECFLAGGGSRSALYRMRIRAKSLREERIPRVREQIESGTMFHGQPAGCFFCVTGFVPDMPT